MGGVLTRLPGAELGQVMDVDRVMVLELDRTVTLGDAVELVSAGGWVYGTLEGVLGEEADSIGVVGVREIVFCTTRFGFRA